MEKNINNKWGKASMILGILSLVLMFAPYIGLPLAVLAVIFSAIQKPKTGQATTGLVTGIIGIVINFFMLLFVAALFSVM